MWSLQVFLRAVNISNTLFHVTAYELPFEEASHDIVPALKFVAYEPGTQMQVQ